MILQQFNAVKKVFLENSVRLKIKEMFEILETGLSLLICLHKLKGYTVAFSV